MIADFLETLDKEGHLDNTIVEMFGDHGDHMNFFLQKTKSGISEKVNPMLVVTVPDTYKERIGDNLEKNTQKLLSHLDLFASDLAIVGFDVSSFNGFYHGVDFFTQQAPVRDCAKASIESRHCQCFPTDKYETTIQESD